MSVEEASGSVSGNSGAGSSGEGERLRRSSRSVTSTAAASGLAGRTRGAYKPRGTLRMSRNRCKIQICRSVYRVVSSIKRSLARKTFSSAPKPRPSENSNPIAPHTRFHASARARPGFPCAPRNAPRRKGGPAEMAMARWPMAALLASVAPIGRHQSDVRGMPPAWNRSAAAKLMVGRWH